MGKYDQGWRYINSPKVTRIAINLALAFVAIAIWALAMSIVID